MQPEIRQFATFCEGVLVDWIHEAPAPRRGLALAAVLADSWTVRFSTPDAPRTDKLAVVQETVIPGQPHCRTGDGIQDLKDLGHDLDNPAAV